MQQTTRRREGKILIVELARRERGNALSRDLQRELGDVWEELEDDDALVLAVLHGSGGVFSIGHDVDELASAQGDAASPLPDERIFPLRLRKPVIAAIEGPCYGLGFELALSCDLRVAGEGASFGFPDRDLLVPYRVASVLLPRMTDLGTALDLLLSGAVLQAARTREARLVHQVVSADQALSSAVALARAMVARFGEAASFKKRQIWSLSGLPLPYALEVVRDAAVEREAGSR